MKVCGRVLWRCGDAAEVQYMWYLFVLSVSSGLSALPVQDEGGKSTGLGPELTDTKPTARYEVTIPQWLTPDGGLKKFKADEVPFRAAIKLTAEGKDLILDIERNKDLFAPGYTETHYSSTGIPKTTAPNYLNHCFYHGTVREIKQSGVVLSTCQGLRGLIMLDSNQSYVIEPLGEDLDQHLIYKAEHLEIKKGTCGHELSNGHSEIWNSYFAKPLGFVHNRIKRDGIQRMKYVELLLVADYAEFQKENGLTKTKMKMLEVANYLDKFYRSLNVRVALIGLEIWNEGNRCNVSESPYSTLSSFLTWRQKILHEKRHDNAQLITGVRFTGHTIGLAPLMTMCSDFQSGGVNQDHSENAIGVAATVAHEMGHNFGMSHDAMGCCTADPSDGGCIMAAATGHPFPKVFNECNKKDLQIYLSKSGGMCLFNLPDTRQMIMEKRCGNGYLEEGEECDCGEVEECISPCCNANNCTLKMGAECADGICCHNCKLKTPGTLCREPSGPCDLPEYCTGTSEFCPANCYQLDGSPCLSGLAYCYSGMCQTFELQCSQLWGTGAKPAPDICFKEVNVAGDIYGNCGKDEQGNYRKCENSDVKCGKIQCQSLADKPKERNAVSIDTHIPLEGRKIKCRGTYVYQASEASDIVDPGLVKTGTKCGDASICIEGSCRNSSFLQSEECLIKCHGHGICNNNKKCHCDPGWAPPFCNTPGNGGSVDSGPVPSDGISSAAVGITIAVLFVASITVASIFFLYKHRSRISVLKGCTQPQENQFSEGTSEPNASNGHSNPVFQNKVKDGIRKAFQTHNTPLLKPTTNATLQAESKLGNISPRPGTSSDILPTSSGTPRCSPPRRPPPPPPKLAVKNCQQPRTADITSPGRSNVCNKPASTDWPRKVLPRIPQATKETYSA